MSWGKYMTALTRGASTIGERACPGSNKRRVKSRTENRHNEKQVAATAELHATLIGSAVPPDFVPPRRKRSSK